ncbi:MAG TPA: PAS domain-containing sensor histidine kinase, partial [Acidimicrobiales bacterium]|nr:PAS domain-containing sensor histidine kinase [Acidimicrobiales bacterium]
TGVGLVGAGRWERPMGTLFLFAGALWLPWTLLLLVAGMAPSGRRWRLQLALYGGPVGDVAVLFAAQCYLAPWAWGILMLANALAVSVAAWMWRGRRSWILLGSAIALSMTAQSFVPAAERQPAGLLAVFALAMVGLTLIVGRIARNHRVAAVTSHHFRQKAETILARVADGIVVTDGNGIVLETNPAGERLMGAEGPFVVGMPCIRALGLHEGERRLDCRTSCPLLQDGPAGEPGPGREVWREISDGRRQPLLASAFAVTDEQGGVEIVHSLRDITRLKEADEAKTLFLATASHELKTPVTVIAGFAETILAYPDMPPERRAQAVEAIRRRATELSAIVDRLLLSSKIESGRVHVDVHPVDVRALVIERSSAFQDASGRHIVRLVADEGLVAMADPLALQTVVDHLLDNAVKYSDGGPVVIRGRRQEGAVEVSVSDIGIGMDEEQARRCFDKFWQAESTDVRRFGGTGIGLYIVSSLVDAMGGTISVETAVGRGSTFTVTLPEVVAPEAAAGLSDQSGLKDFMRQVGALSRGNA